MIPQADYIELYVILMQIRFVLFLTALFILGCWLADFERFIVTRNKKAA